MIPKLFKLLRTRIHEEKIFKSKRQRYKYRETRTWIEAKREKLLLLKETRMDILYILVVVVVGRFEIHTLYITVKCTNQWTM